MSLSVFPFTPILYGWILTQIPQTALLFAQAMSEKLPRAEGIPSEVRSWSDFAGGKLL